MDVQIQEIITGKIMATYPINLGGQNYTPSEQEYFNEAWRCAIEDGLVTNQPKDKYSFSFAPD